MILACHNLTKSFGEQVIVNKGSFHIEDREKAALVGLNGAGKSTILKMIVGELNSDDGDVILTKGKTMGYLAQHQDLMSGNTIYEEVRTAKSEIIEMERQIRALELEISTLTGDALQMKLDTYHRLTAAFERADGYSYKSELVGVLKGLGFTEDEFQKPVDALSGGQKTRVSLGKLLLTKPDILLLDEPTNHLDKEAREIVKKYLASKKGFILVSHDRDLLDGCIDHCLVLTRSSIEVQRGNFSTWWENKQRKDQFVLAENEKHQKEIGKLRQAARRTSEWADRNERTKIGYDPIKEHDRPLDSRCYIGAKTKKMQSRVKQMEKRIHREIEEKEGLLQDIERTLDLKLFPQTHHKNTLVNMKEYSLRYTDAKNPIFEKLTFAICQGERIALSGKNGCGKSSLIKMILQKTGFEHIAMDIKETGVCETASGLTISYVGQEACSLKGDIATYCKERALDQSLFCAILRQLDFERIQFMKHMEEYSEGQKKKILIATSLLTPAHLYIWDEPLNYIDIFSRMQIEKLLLTYQPTMLFVEHDVRFCEKIATRTIKL